MTLSITARCHDTGQFGIAVATGSICVGARCVWTRAAVGAVATQSRTNPALGRTGLDLLQSGLAGPAVLARLVASEGDRARFRQLAVLGRSGPPVAHTGAAVSEPHAQAFGRDCVAIGNLLARRRVAGAMVAGFESSPEAAFGARLLCGLEAGIRAGGQGGGVHSAALQLVSRTPWPVCDLRIDWADHDPVGRLRALWIRYAPEQETFTLRALAPERTGS